MQGKIKQYDQSRGFGYLVDDEGQEIFMHITGIIQGNPKLIHAGDPVEFVIAPGKNGPQAAKIRLAR
ncbi:cold-shock protein [Fructilactobacillus cliffordii]|uniref:Cold shock domain-containing protein n=1 Tax=Fructilactobacillus cliffordii TaxID=2940299 RepID=A0A9Q9E274_9LACO|nr:cold shock domain-containing protein [Fructilactobacillus cliffordii]USS86400.1 cold shock domain-containing protein [Fructilactobacillus cliffordii]USS89465.1 cold shock domain-containing protein [Fructilactobacillus cliffordii]